MLYIILNLLFALTALCADAITIPPISSVGNKFFTIDGKQFYIKGVAYQLTDSDPLINTAQCQRDADLMGTLGVNSIRVYHVDSTADHSGCMNAFAQKGIYAWVDMDSFYTYIRYQGQDPVWNRTKSDAYRAVMDNFQQYQNTAGLFVGNEVLNIAADASSAPYLLAAAVDLKGYRKAKGYRDIPIGYSATDTAVLRPYLQDYLVCRPNATERLDFYALNSYEWCGSATNYQTSGYETLQDMLMNYPVPIFFSEDGCNTVPPRTFSDQHAIFTSPMSDLWSGAIIYEWIQEVNGYGLIQYGPQNTANPNQGTSVIDGFSRGGTPTPVQPDFMNLQSQWSTLSPTGVQLAAYKATFKTIAPACPSSIAPSWTVDASSPLPTVGQAGVTPGMPTNVPQGSVTPFTAAASTSHSSSAETGTKTNSASGTGSGSGSATGTATAASSASATKGAAGKGPVNPLSTSGEIGFLSCVVALITVGAGAILLL